MIRRWLVLVVLGAMLSLTACSFDIGKVPLPGGADVGDDPIELTATFPDVLDLVPQSTVKLADVTIGKVTSVELDGQKAKVTLEIRRDADLPANTTAEIRQTSLLGEKFVSLNVPEEPAAETLGNGDSVALAPGNRNPEVEEVLGALSLVLNGGGVAQLKTISSELNNALTGKEGNVKSVLTQLDDFMSELDLNKRDIVKAIESLNRLSITANSQMDDITLALDKLPEAVASLDSQREDLVKMLKSLAELSDVGVRVISASKDVTIDALTQLQPVLTEFAKSGDNFADAFHVFLTYPFVDEAVGRDPQVARNLHMGDYVNLHVKLDIRLDGSMKLPIPTLLPSEVDPTVLVDNLLKCLTSGKLTSKSCSDVLAVPSNLLKLQKLCKKSENSKLELCKVINSLPDLGLGGLPTGTSSGARADSKSSNGVEDLINSLGLLSLPGLKLNRSTPGGPSVQGTATIGELSEVYNPTLVRLLVPGVAR
ncbi:phospholipid/cholesterol/gamma-HCH transport system substrate-binding protein [Nocardioides daedukensis]|uniref:Phospholipid/cholesterol/gamma-HCH transport system substrate-binding protein n=1 Tax=Nocardioides daedukensis TaxID=634462 RepID=A0A7Y9UQN9_9ACTN|nr:MCE family protein [Nocardioides daedukensis]NYG58796.1 phospholipid/cholesterol/gamma-HCH transport system substrate-binding protein [Nocardioides daedukensis]